MQLGQNPMLVLGSGEQVRCFTWIGDVAAVIAQWSFAPETEKRTAQFLREVSEKLREAASWIEARNAARSAQTPKDSQS